MSDEDDTFDNIKEILESLDEDSLRPVSDMEDFNFIDIIDQQSYLISQPHLINDTPWKLNNRSRKLNKHFSKDKIYDNDK